MIFGILVRVISFTISRNMGLSNGVGKMCFIWFPYAVYYLYFHIICHTKVWYEELERTQVSVFEQRGYH